MNVSKIYNKNKFQNLSVKRKSDLGGVLVSALFGGFFPIKLHSSQIRSLLQSIVTSKTDNWKLPYSDKHE